MVKYGSPKYAERTTNIILYRPLKQERSMKE